MLDDLPDTGLARLRGPDLPLLVSLDVLLEECNVTRAAARLHLSQPALSAQLARLRQLFDDPLLEPAPVGRGLVRTSFALELQRRLRPALAALSDAVHARQEDFAPRRSARCFRIAASGTAAAMALPALVGQVRAAGAAGLRFESIEAEPARLAGQMARGEVDLCIGPACMLPPGLRSADLLESPYVLVQRAGHPRGTNAAGLDEYCEGLEHLNLGPLHNHIDEELYRRGRSRRVALAVREHGLMASLLSQGGLVATLPERLASELGPGIACAPLGFALTPYTLCMAWHATRDQDAGLAWLRAATVAALRTPPPAG